MARRINKKVNLTPPVKRRVTPGDIGQEVLASQSDRDAGVTEADMVGVYYAVENHAANMRDFARQRITNTCIDISNEPDLQRHLAIMYLEDTIQRGTATDIVFSEEAQVMYDVPVTHTASEQDFLASLQVDLASVGLDSISEASTTAPLTLQLMVLKNLPTQLCGDDIAMAYDRLHESFAADSLEEIQARQAGESQDGLLGGEKDPDSGGFNPLGKWTILWAIILIFFVEFGLLFVMKQVAGLFSRWPLKPIYNFLRGMVQKVLKKISTIVLNIVFGESEGEEDDQFRSMQLQQAMLFAGGANPLVTIGTMVGIV